MLLDPDQPLVIRWQYLPLLAPYLLRFIAAARPSRVEKISEALASLLGLAIDAYKPLIADAGASDLIRHTGELYVYEKAASFRAAQSAHELRRMRGVQVQHLEPHELRQLEPALAPIFARGVYLPDCIQTTDPYLFTAKLADHFARDGGRILQEKVEEIAIGPNGPTRLRTTAGERPVDELVIAAGAYSKRWAAKMGSKIPLDTERGYHLMLPNPGVELRVPVISGDYRFGLVQMQDGIRLAGTAELARLDAPPNYARAERLLALAQRVLPGLSGEGSVSWMGHRPSTPDSLPVVCRSANFRSVYFAFGHGHLGLTLGAATGRVIADLIAERPTAINIAPFHAERFGPPWRQRSSRTERARAA
jgi:D-amino-acid dehydrogenase